MTQEFDLRAGQSCQVLSMERSQQAVFVYRIAVNQMIDCDLKVIRDGLPAITISPRQPHKTIDVAASSNLYLEATGSRGVVSGTYECVGG